MTSQMSEQQSRPGGASNRCVTQTTVQLVEPRRVCRLMYMRNRRWASSHFVIRRITQICLPTAARASFTHVTSQEQQQ